MDSTKALELAGRLASSFPRYPLGEGTIIEWAREFMPVPDEIGEVTVDLLKALYEKVPSIPQIRKAIRTAVQRRAGFVLSSNQEPEPGVPTTFADWAVTDPVRARKLVGALVGTSYVHAELEDVIAKGAEIFDSLATDKRSEPQRWDGSDSPCVHCRQPVGNGPDAASRWDGERWINAHLSCADAAGVRR